MTRYYVATPRIHGSITSYIVCDEATGMKLATYTATIAGQEAAHAHADKLNRQSSNPRPVAMLSAECRVVGTNRRTGRLQAAGYFATEADAEQWIVTNRARYHLADLYIELPEQSTGEYIQLGLI